MDHKRRIKTSPEGIGHLSIPSEGRSGKGDVYGSPEPVARSNERSTTGDKQQLNTASWQVWCETILGLLSGVSGLLIVARTNIIHYLKERNKYYTKIKIQGYFLKPIFSHWGSSALRTENCLMYICAMPSANFPFVRCPKSPTGGI